MERIEDTVIRSLLAIEPIDRISLIPFNPTADRGTDNCLGSIARLILYWFSIDISYKIDLLAQRVVVPRRGTKDS